MHGFCGGATMRELDALEDFGLSEAESKVYLALLDTGSTLAGNIIQKTGLHRGTTYQVLQRLKEKGVVSSVIKGRKQHFEPVNPDQLLRLLKDKEDRLMDVLPLLKEKFNDTKEQQDVTVYSGIRGIKSLLDTVLEDLNPKGEYYDFGVSGLFKTVVGPYWELWQKRKRKYGIRSYVIFNEEVKEKDPELLRDYFGEARFHRREYSSLTDTIIYKDVVILFIWTARPPIAVFIKNKDNAKSYKNQFKSLWDAAMVR